MEAVEVKDARLLAIRTNRLVGLGSCSSIDECWEDSEILAELEKEGIVGELLAVSHFLGIEELFLEQGLNQRWGEADDPQLLQYDEFRRAAKEWRDSIPTA